MWPWEHLAFGYLLYSLYCRIVRRESPGSPDTLVLVFTTQLPDLVDKPLAWVFGVLPSGLSLGHSLVVGLPVCLLVIAVARWTGRAELGSAYCVGFLSHVAGDLLYPLALGGQPDPRFLLWPLANSGSMTGEGFVVRVSRLWESFAAFTVTPQGQVYLAVEAVFLVATVAVWLADGRPGLRNPFHRSPEADTR
jgi:hypothetical protein